MVKQRMTFAELWSDWAHNFCRSELQIKQEFVWVFFRTLPKDTRAKSYLVGDTAFIYLSNRIRTWRGAQDAIMHELIHIKLRHGRHDKEFKRWAKKFNVPVH